MSVPSLVRLVRVYRRTYPPRNTDDDNNNNNNAILLAEPIDCSASILAVLSLVAAQLSYRILPASIERNKEQLATAL
ncbi:hypothetical protein M514_06910 [Trichuris suis]|uniref:Uncharacterized protein n=1 Tax=Trichuris suis TaxID=68888 RepID=A0A085NLL6_9BILA|nr:hypothetical protein M513_06910 [Trichuris suis]KFD70362.1 hypothetical protein M514_06910 [Trichuris suis]